jgi:DNA-binding MarR family transcriptional regulator
MMYSQQIKKNSDGDRDFDLWLLLTRARYAVYRARELELLRYGLTPEQSQVLFVISSMKEDATPAAIARATFLKSHTISAIVDRMVRKGLLKKSKDLVRKNRVIVTTTKKGAEAFALSSKRGPIHRILSAVNDKERDQLTKVLEKILFAAGDELGLNKDKLPSSD